MFGKKHEEPKEEVTQPEVTPPVSTGPDAPTPAVEETPEMKREKASVKMLITYFPDNGEIQVANVQNLTRPVAEFVIYKVSKTYEFDEISRSVTTRLIDTIIKQKDGSRIVVPK